ncbi:hypothetical protein C6503_18085 [Candidatus Poribacteria bacterium]|nr:MAG: hypothetical protein C6503_18085 [Candidatus Poribacteria bacterium]
MKVTKLRSWLKPMLVLSIICGFALTATAQNYYPLEVGNTWILESTDGAERLTYSITGPEVINGQELKILNIVTSLTGDPTGEPTDHDKYFVTLNDEGILLHQTITNEGAFGIAEATFDPPAIFFPTALPVGHQWEVVTETVLDLVGPVTSTSTITVEAIEDVETPAGIFQNCVKLDIDRKVDTAAIVVPYRFRQWLAPDVGPIKFQNVLQDVTYELQSYNLVEPTVEAMQPTEETTEEVTEETTEETIEEVTEETTEEVTDETTQETAEEVTEVEVPAEPMMPREYGFDVTLEPGLNMIAIPLMPEKPYTAKSLAAMLEATLVIRLDVATQQFSAYTSLDEGDGFGIDGGMGYIVNTPTGGMVKFTGKAWDNQSEAPDDAPAAPTLSRNKNTWAFVVTSDIRDMETGTSYTLVAKNLRTDTIATETITSEVKRSSAVWADLNRKSVVKAGDKLEIALYDERGNIVSGPFQRIVSTADIHNAFLSLQLTVGDVQPKDTILAQNYPNPFNPETWIPYQLSQSAEVSIHIHNVAGHLIRTLDLGLKPTGSYMTPSTAAYWDGKNSVGESVASGIYFYTLQTADFAATRRMVILK